MKVSVIIPTYNRKEDLIEVLNSILCQSVLPLEVIIVDDSDNDQIFQAIIKIKPEFLQKNTDLVYLKNSNGQKSITIARNIGMNAAIGDIILFLDDDVILDQEYTKKILDVFNKFPEAVGVQGFITNFPLLFRSKYLNSLARIFLLGFIEKDQCRVLASTNLTYPSELTAIRPCEWLSGANHAYKKESIKMFNFDEKLLKYAFKEDFDFSYRVGKKYGKVLYISPYAMLTHKISSSSRMPDKIRTYMEYSHNFYLFFKNMDPDLIRTFQFFWSIFGYLVVSLPFAVFSDLNKNTKEQCIQWLYNFKGIIFSLNHIRDFKKGDLSSLHQIL
jgi:glycosyltransferase involved in cell wall biosynthesis